MINGNIEKIFEGFGWKDLGPQKMKRMMSFVFKNYRANYYSTTGTLTIQNTKFKYDRGESVNIGQEGGGYLKYILQKYV